MSLDLKWEQSASLSNGGGWLLSSCLTQTIVFATFLDRVLFFTMPDPTESSKQCARFPLAEYLDGTRPFDDNTPTIDMHRLKERKA